jgi:hypothetical protein
MSPALITIFIAIVAAIVGLIAIREFSHANPEL